MRADTPNMATDFLGHLVAKARGVGSAIAPRLPSLFEPVPGTHAEVGEDSAERPTWPPVPLGERPHPAPDAWPIPPDHESHTRHFSSVEKVAHGDGVRRLGQGDPVDEPPAGPALVADRLAVTAVPPAMERPPPRQDRAGWTNHAEPAAESGPAPTAAANPVVEHHAAARVVEPPAPEQQRRRKEPGALVPDLPEAVAALAPHIGLKATRGRYGIPPAEGVPDQPAPVINVTIGRVEVRATQAAPAGPRAAPAKQKALSLDDYLKQRGGRR